MGTRTSDWLTHELELDMPDTRVDIDLIKVAVQLACRAPSLHNSQP
jgi:hypothetical protein